MRNARRGEDGRDADGVRVVVTGRRRDVWLVVALGIALVGLLVALRPRDAAHPPRATETASAHADAAGAVPAAPAPAPATPDTPQAPAHDAAPPPGWTPEAWRAERQQARADARATAKEPTVTVTAEPSGVALFPPPGTKPVKRGIVVPEDFPLPPGYVRHYQTTDDGEMLPAILMFSPDYEPRDAEGNVVPLPADRIVPPEMAPPGLPIEQLAVPEPKRDDAP